MVNLPYVDVGLQTRYGDCVSGIERLNLKSGDEILNLINYR